MVDAIVAGEAVKLLLMGWFEYLKSQGISEEEAEKLYQKQKAKMFERDPDDLTDV